MSNKDKKNNDESRQVFKCIDLISNASGSSPESYLENLEEYISKDSSSKSEQAKIDRLDKAIKFISILPGWFAKRLDAKTEDYIRVLNKAGINDRYDIRVMLRLRLLNSIGLDRVAFDKTNSVSAGFTLALCLFFMVLGMSLIKFSTLNASGNFEMLFYWVLTVTIAYIIRNLWDVSYGQIKLNQILSGM